MTDQDKPTAPLTLDALRAKAAREREKVPDSTGKGPFILKADGIDIRFRSLNDVPDWRDVEELRLNMELQRFVDLTIEDDDELDAFAALQLSPTEMSLLIRDYFDHYSELDRPADASLNRAARRARR